MKCSIGWCERPEELSKSGGPTGGLCSGHRYRKKRGLEMKAPFHKGLARALSPRGGLIEAALCIARDPGLAKGLEQGQGLNFQARDRFTKAVERLTHAAEVYVRGRRRRASRKAPSTR